MAMRGIITAATTIVCLLTWLMENIDRVIEVIQAVIRLIQLVRDLLEEVRKNECKEERT